MGDFAVLMTARLMVLTYVVRLLVDVHGWPTDVRRLEKWERAVRWVWTIGCSIFLLHVVAAFQFVHGWSHAAAYAHTAKQTAAVTGWQWGGGLWINYALVLWWPVDVVWSWRRGMDHLPRGYVIGMHMIVGFLMFNATVVFGAEWWRWMVVPTLGALVWSRWDGRRGDERIAPDGRG
ncbi:MAG: hypothetical protein KDA93_00375 [Planctomycetaceae bacterium]|nr:hypothetical protein [Planctomycetaceae bacterium]